MRKIIFILTMLQGFAAYSQRDSIKIDRSMLNAENGISFGSGNVFTFSPATATGRASFYIGPKIGLVAQLLKCPNPNTNTQAQFISNGAFISRVPAGTSGPGNFTNSSLSFYSAPWDGNGFIEVEGLDKNGEDKNALGINYFCHRNTFINTGWDIPGGVSGGTVYLGAKVDMQKSLKLGWSSSGDVDLNTSIEINQNDKDAHGVKINTYNSGLKAYSILRADNKYTFLVYGDGRTQIGLEKVGSGPHTDAMLSVSGKIACKEVRVFNNASGYWADFVFEKKYKLMPLTDVEKFYTNNKHLPDVPTAKQIATDGNDLAKTDALLLRKIEELTLYVVQQQKEINALKKKVNKNMPSKPSYN